ncbi:hypothetical protein AYK21_02260 [Thermoplasmatales archaeon SG8-52-2]|nr:MAG: hypothetical protein AYK21_02260 [Thermoplasmatales archaeon SG8-52-2]
MNKILFTGLIILFLVSVINPSVAIDNVKKSSFPISKGNTLYVGGSGPNNYTKIQDAIDNSSDEDSVFVYDDSSPYYGKIRVHKSINLMGENKNTTVISAINSHSCLVSINANFVNISGFTIKNGQEGIIGIRLKNCTIYDNNIINNHMGIHLFGSNNFTFIYNNISNNKYGGFYLEACYNLSIRENIIDYNRVYGILLFGSINSTIIKNSFLGNGEGLEFLSTNNIVVHFNNIKNNDIGFFMGYSDKTLIKQNNFIKNEIHFLFCFSFRIRFVSNYWDDWIGVKIKLPLFNRFPKIIWYQGSFRPKIDWIPSKEPYDIKV